MNPLIPHQLPHLPPLLFPPSYPCSLPWLPKASCQWWFCLFSAATGTIVNTNTHNVYAGRVEWCTVPRSRVVHTLKLTQRLGVRQHFLLQSLLTSQCVCVHPLFFGTEQLTSYLGG